MAPDRRPGRAAAARDATARPVPRQGLRRWRRARRPRVPAARAADLPCRPHRSRPGAVLGRVRALGHRVQPGVGARLVRPGAPPGLAAAQPLLGRVGAAVPRLQHRRELRHQHELAELRRRDDDERPGPDDRAHGAELRLGRGRHGGRRRADPRLHAPARGDHRQLLGRPHKGRDPRPAPAGAGARRRARRPRRRADAAGARGRDHRGGRDPDDLPRSRSRARSRSRSWGRTAAAS